MHNIVSKILLYKSLPEYDVLEGISAVSKAVYENKFDNGDILIKLYDEIRKLLKMASKYGFDKNIWHDYLTYLIIMDENPLSLSCEKNDAGLGSMVHFAKNDLGAFMKLFRFDFGPLEKALGTDVLSVIQNYVSPAMGDFMYDRAINEKVRLLSDKLSSSPDEETFIRSIIEFYRRYGVGSFGMNKAFRFDSDESGNIVFKPISNMVKVSFSDIIGYEIQKAKLIENTRAFVLGKRANNVLLYGDSGTGKSTSIKAVVNEFYADGLRMIEIYKHQFKDLSLLVSQIKSRNYKFIIYMDDLSFEDNETEYKFLKAVIEGGMETVPENILIYATSNRRHLIREIWRDRNDVEVTEADVHHSDTIEEKLSLAHRFGVTINFSKPTRAQYIDIVSKLAEKNGLKIDKAELKKEADRWEMAHGGLSGRTAQQFINYLLGK
ncbi:MAG: ATP-binding protein [Clostridia bacterium]|nr:ATP-binding protein [Clostridia bacterium]